jgi:L-ascorbate metabolism protein UlaG (beta-lactamase superfamily)
MLRLNRLVIACVALMMACAHPMSRSAVGPDHVDITWMSVTNMFYEIGSFGVVTDGYISRVPKDIFFGATTGMAQTRIAQKPDVAAVRRVLSAIGGPSKIRLLLTGHSHFDHSFDTAVWARLADAPIMGSRTTCYQAIAQQIPASRCTAVNGGEHYQIADGVTMWVVRFNHSGDHAVNPDQHDPVELESVPHPAANGGLRAGLQEDFPNGGGNRAYLFVVDGPSGRYSWFFNNSASAVDIDVPIVIDGVNYGAPLENLKTAMRSAGLESVDLWIGAGSAEVLKRLQPVLKPRTFIPVHWDDFWAAFDAGVTSPYSDPATEAFMRDAGVKVFAPRQYMDKWRLSRNGVEEVENATVKRALGFR